MDENEIKEKNNDATSFGYDKDQVLASLKYNLGSGNYDVCLKLYKKAKDVKTPYKVILSDRCADLLRMISIAEGEEDNFDDQFFTPECLLSNIDEIMDDYEKYDRMFFPRILVVDDVLMYGRRINWFCSLLIDSVYHQMRKRKIHLNLFEVESLVLNNLKIITAAKNFEGNLLLERKFWNSLNFLERYEMCDLLNFSLSVTKAVSACGFPERKFMPYLRIESCDSEALMKVYDWLNANMTPSSINGDGRITKIWMKPLTDGNNVKAIWIVRSLTSEIDGSKNIIPSVITSDLAPFKKVLVDLLDKDFDGSLSSLYEYWGDKFPSEVDLLLLIVYQNFLLNLCNDCSIDPEKVVYDRTAFRGENSLEPNAFFDHIVVRKSPWLTSDDMNHMILELTAGSLPLLSLNKKISCSDVDLVDLADKVKKKVGDVISDFVYDDAYHIHMSYIKEEYPYSKRISRYSFTELYSVSKSGFENVDDLIFLNHFLTIVILMLDMEVIRFNILLNEEGKYLFRVEPGEVALFYLPNSLYQFINVLFMFERKSQYYVPREISYTRRWFKDKLDKNTIDKLVDMLNKFEKAGYHVEDWKVDFSTWALEEELSGKGLDFIGPEDIRRQKSAKMMKCFAAENEYTYQYLDWVRKTNNS